MSDLDIKTVVSEVEALLPPDAVRVEDEIVIVQDSEIKPQNIEFLDNFDVQVSTGSASNTLTKTADSFIDELFSKRTESAAMDELISNTSSTVNKSFPPWPPQSTPQPKNQLSNNATVEKIPSRPVLGDLSRYSWNERGTESCIAVCGGRCQ